MAPSISGCLIVKNEAQHLARCLSSIVSFVDELVVVDTGSTDETVAIAQGFGAIIHHFEWCDDFAAARNFALEHVKGKWILMLDADEEIVEAHFDWGNHLPEEPHILALKINLRPPENSVTILQAIRLFRNIPDLRYVGRYHEHLMLHQNILPAESIVHFDAFNLIHYGYALDILPEKSQARIPMLERLRQSHGLSYNLLWTLSGMYECVGQWEKSQGCYEEASERLFENLISGTKPDDFRAIPSWLYGLGELYLKAENYESVQLICNRALDWCPSFPPIFYLTGLLIMKLGFVRGAAPYFEVCLEFERTGRYQMTEPFSNELINLLPHYQLGLIYRRLECNQRAINHFKACLSFQENYPLALDQLSELEGTY